MDGLHELTAAGLTVSIGGKEYRFAPLRLRDWGELERRILASRPDPLDLVLAKLPGLPEALQRELLNTAYHDARKGERVTAAEMSEWLATPEGRVYQFWLSVRQHHPEVTLDEAEGLIRQFGSESPERGAATAGNVVGNG